MGVGYYPRSTFVHLDVRDRSAYWVDRSRPGQAPQYQRQPAAAGESPEDGDGDGETAAPETGGDAPAESDVTEQAADSAPERLASPSTDTSDTND